MAPSSMPPLSFASVRQDPEAGPEIDAGSPRIYHAEFAPSRHNVLIRINMSRRQQRSMVYEAVTHGVRVSAQPDFATAESDAREKRFLWRYTITIHNERTDAVQLLSRHWQIIDGKGQIHDVKGRGVVGEQPIIAPNAQYAYTSQCPLTTPHGSMSGSYEMRSLSGEVFQIDIPAFPLMSPFAKGTQH
jgi:ApaG protein